MDNSDLLSIGLEENNNDIVLTNSLSSYIKDLSHYSLLSSQDEIKYATMLKNSKDSKLLEFNNLVGNTAISLNIPLLFRSLINNTKSYREIIDILLKLYSKIDNKTNETNSIYRYKIESNRLNRSLNSEELKEIFNIDDGETLNDIELVREVKKYIAYKYAFYKMFVSNLRLVIYFAKNKQSSLTIRDLIQEGNLGLMKAIEKFDVSLGYKFSTYASRWIEDYMDVASSYNSTIRIPRAMLNNLRSFEKKVDSLEKEYNRKLTDEEIANKLSISVEEVRENYDYLDKYKITSLDKPLGENKDMTMQDIIPDSNSLEEEAMRKFLKEDIKELFTVLTEREKQVIKMRFGIGEYNGKDYSIAEISKTLSVSPSIIRQNEVKALIKMRRYAKSNDSIKLYLR